MRIRTIKPEWLEDEKLAAASDEARVLSVALILMSDDHGRGRASIATIAAETWRYALERNDGADAPEVLARASRALRELVEVGFVGLYEVKGQRYFEVINWKKHQKVDKPSAPRVPAPEAQETPKKADIREGLASHSRDPRETLALDLDPDLDPVPRPGGEQRAGESDATPVLPDSFEAKRGYLLRAHRDRYEAATSNPVPSGKNAPQAVDRVTAWLAGYAQRTGQSYPDAVDAVLGRWWADPYAASKGWPIGLLAKDVDQFAESLPPALTVVKGGMLRPGTHAEHAADAAAGGSPWDL